MANVRAIASPIAQYVTIKTAGGHHLLETKGREDVDVAFKDRAATIWCESATLLTGTNWRYTKVLQAEFNKLQPSDLSDVTTAFDLGLDRAAIP